MKSLSKIALSAFLIASLPVFAGVPGLGLPKTSKHESFKPEDFERIAVIVKPFKAQLGGGAFDPTTGLSTGTIHLQTGQHHNQTQPERLVEQRFMRVLLGDGYTLVSRTDLDAAMKEKVWTRRI